MSDHGRVEVFSGPLPGCSTLPPMNPPTSKATTTGSDHQTGGANEPSGKARTGERFRVLNTFVDFALADLTRAAIAVWLILFRDTRDGTARTGIADIARRAGCNRSTAFRALRELEGRELVKVVYRGGLGKGISRYRVHALAKDG